MSNPIKLIKNIIKKQLFRREWRKSNSNNQTSALNIFDMSLVTVGKMSYGPLEVHSWKSEGERLVIGNYVSISSGVKFILGGNHHYNTFSTYPFKVKLELQEIEAYTNGPIVIEDDVWIGTDVLVMSGITISKGAVVAAGSVVVKNVPPYSIVGGNPAKIIKMRFEESIIEKLISIDFSEIDNNIVKNNIDLFYENLDSETLEKIVNILQNNSIMG